MIENKVSEVNVSIQPRIILICFMQLQKGFEGLERFILKKKSDGIDDFITEIVEGDATSHTITGTLAKAQRRMMQKRRRSSKCSICRQQIYFFSNEVNLKKDMESLMVSCLKKTRYG